jgi:hypothetical protein
MWRSRQRRKCRPGIIEWEGLIEANQDTPLYNAVQNLQGRHHPETEDTGPNDRHNPVERSLSGPTVPAEGSEDEEGPKQRNCTYKRPIGTKKDPKKRAGIRISGVDTPPFFSPSFRQPEKVNYWHFFLRTVE